MPVMWLLPTEAHLLPVILSAGIFFFITCFLGVFFSITFCRHMIGGPMACVFGRCRYGPFSLGRPSSLLLLLRGTPSAVGSEVCGSPSLASPSVRRGRPSRLVWVLELLTARRRVAAPRLVSAEEGQVAATGKEGARCRTERGR